MIAANVYILGDEDATSLGYVDCSHGIPARGDIIDMSPRPGEHASYRVVSRTWLVSGIPGSSPKSHGGPMLFVRPAKDAAESAAWKLEREVAADVLAWAVSSSEDTREVTVGLLSNRIIRRIIAAVRQGRLVS